MIALINFMQKFMKIVKKQLIDQTLSMVNLISIVYQILPSLTMNGVLFLICCLSSINKDVSVCLSVCD